MADTKLPVFNNDAQTAYIDMRTEATNGEGRQVVVLGDPSINANVATVATQDLGGSDQTTPGVVFRLAGSAAVQVVGSSGTLGVHITGTSGTLNVQLDPGTTLEGIQSSVAVHLLSTAGSLVVKLDPDSTLGGVRNSVAVHLGSTAGTIGVRVGQVDGTVAVYFSQSKPAVLSDAQHTASIFTVSGSTSGGTTSGVTLISPSAAYNFKIFAYSIQTTGVVSSAIRFTNGAESATELWRPLITAAATTSSPVGANLAVTPPGYIFATGTNTTLALKNDSGSLVHYSVSYIKESA